jgi:hypothetical protein
MGKALGMEKLVSMWGEHGERPEPASVEVACAPLAAWQLVTNIGRIGEFSPECIDARWVDGATEPAAGARFDGTNRIVDDAGDRERIWIRPCTVTTAQAPERFSYTVGDRYDGTPATLWDVVIEPTATGCRITQHFQHLPRGLSGIRHQADENPAQAEVIVNQRVQGLTAGMRQTLQRMKGVLESRELSGTQLSV